MDLKYWIMLAQATSKITPAEMCVCVCVCQKDNVKTDQPQCSSQRFCFPPFCGEESLWKAIGNGCAEGIRLKRVLCVQDDMLSQPCTSPPPSNGFLRAHRLAGPWGLGVRVHTQPDDSPATRAARASPRPSPTPESLSIPFHPHPDCLYSEWQWWMGMLG